MPIYLQVQLALEFKSAFSTRRHWTAPYSPEEWEQTRAAAQHRYPSTAVTLSCALLTLLVSSVLWATIKFPEHSHSAAQQKSSLGFNIVYRVCGLCCMLG